MAHHKVVQAALMLLLAAAVSQMLTSVEGRSNVYATYKLANGQMLIDDGNSYLLVMQKDCNLVLYEPRRNGAALYSSGTNGRGDGCYATTTIEGQFAIYDGNDKFVWATDSKQSESDAEGCIFNAVVQSDGNFVIYCDAGEYSDKTTHAIWSSNTAGQ